MKFQLKRSNQLTQGGTALTPDGQYLEFGEIAINYNATDPAIFFKDTQNNVIRLSGVNAQIGSGDITLTAGSGISISNPNSFNLQDSYDTNITISVNQGTGSGLDADLLDGQHGSYYQNASNLNAGTISNDRLPSTINSDITGNADTVDNLHAASFLRSDANDTYSRLITGNQLHLGGSQIMNSSASLQVNGFSRQGTIYLHDLTNGVDSPLKNVNGELIWNTDVIWHAGNDGSGSGLDADTLDGFEGSYYQNASNLNAGTIPDARISDIGNSQARLITFDNVEKSDLTADGQLGFDSSQGLLVFRAQQGTSGAATTILDGWNVEAGSNISITNLGAGSTSTGQFIFSVNRTNLDADLLDGQHGSYYRNASNLNAGTIPDARIPDTITPVTLVQTKEIRTSNGTEVVINAGESSGKFSGQTAEKVYLNAESGIRITTPTVSNYGSGYQATYTEITGKGIYFRYYDPEDSAVERVGEITSQDDSWLRINQETNKNIYTPRYIRADAGFFVDSTSKGINGSGNFIGGTIAGASDVTDANTANTIVKRNGSSDINCRLVRQSYQNQNSISGGIVFRVNNSNDNYLRVCNNAGNIRTFLGVTATASDGNYLRSNASDQYDGQTSGRVMRFRCVDGRNAGSSSGSLFPLEVYQSSNGTNSDAAMAFHIAGRYAAYFGLDRQTNDLFFGGWSRGAAKYKVWHAANDGSGSGLDADTVDGIQGASFLRSDANDTATGQITFNGRVNIRGHIDLSDGENLDFGSSDDVRVNYNSNNWLYWDFRTGNGIVYRDNGTDKIILEDSGIIRPAATNTGTIGTSSRYWDNGYFQDFNISSNLNVQNRIYVGSSDNGQAIEVDRSSSYNTHLYIGGWSSSNSNDIARIRCSNNLHIDSPANGHIYFNWYSKKNINYKGPLLGGDTTSTCRPTNGSATAPGLSFAGDSDTGFYRGANNRINFTTGGAYRGFMTGSDFRYAGIYSATVSGGTNVRVDSNGRLRRHSSSRRTKTNIEPMEADYAYNILNQVEPIWYRPRVPDPNYPQEYLDNLLENESPSLADCEAYCQDNKIKWEIGDAWMNEGCNPNWSYWGFIAEDIAEIDPRLCQQNPDTGEYDSVQYEEFTPLLLKIAQEQKKTITSLEKRLTELEQKFVQWSASDS